ncbi:flagellar basal-body MS-ring/collar protein FliF [Thermodesulforhabdus norvegica]|uniref:Flagellar M-ring protein n=1 Tax=Thermodesulforhabdus norvegica TaxID=39841 RepID=A0A1I4R767_9BACT|nr:flagellar basal-body MS-ring/collar protein FliF [Thermodesulforhabdus norvegica]SFM47790.1 flagellar M-ring protein FliF [Thermodesulforhabdus norvegica]
MALDRIMLRLKGLAQAFRNLTTPVKILVVGTFLAVTFSTAFVFYQINRPELALLYGRMNERDMALVVEQLKQQKVPYRIEGDRIFVPKDRLYEVRLALAREGIPRGTGVGFEIFDEQRLGATEFVQRVNYQRALQGELARTIAAMDKIEEARVHLVIPEETLFVEDQKPPSAAIVIRVKEGQQLTSRDLQGMVHLVSSSVKGLTEDHVTIVSTDGRVLYKKDSIDRSFELSELQLSYKEKIEEALERKAQSMLASVLGANDVIVRVSADVDFSEVHVTEELFDPDTTAVRSQQRMIERSNQEPGGPKGNPDVPINVESKLLVSKPPQGGEGESTQIFERQQDITNYEINKTLRRVVYAPGAIKRLTVAVVVDGPYKEEKTADNVIKKVFVGRSEDELKAIESIVKNAVGYNPDRGDEITVSNIPFAEEIAPKPAPTRWWLAMLKEHRRLIVNVLLALLVLLFVVRPLIKKLEKIPVEVQPKALPPTEEEMAELEAMKKALTPRQQAALFVQERPEKAAEIIRAWLHEEEA